MAFEWLFLISLAAGFVGAMSGTGDRIVLIPPGTLCLLFNPSCDPARTAQKLDILCHGFHKLAQIF